MEICKFLILVTVAVTWSAISLPSLLAYETAVINFFLNDNLLSTTPPSTAFPILPPLLGSLFSKNQTYFGALIVFDDSLTVGPDPSTLEIGKGRGFYLFDENDSDLGPAIEFSWTAEFNEASGYGKGSTLTFKGLDRLYDSVREIAIVGGTGTFRLARGWAVITTYNLIGADALLNITASVYYGI